MTTARRPGRWLAPRPAQVPKRAGVTSPTRPLNAKRAPRRGRAFGQLLGDQRLMSWAWEELNLRPHAYQPTRGKAHGSDLRALHGLPTHTTEEAARRSAPETARSRVPHASPARPAPRRPNRVGRNAARRASHDLLADLAVAVSLVVAGVLAGGARVWR